MAASDSEYNEMLRDLVDYANELGYDVVGEIESDEAAVSVDGFVIDCAGPQISLITAPTQRWVTIQFTFDVREQCILDDRAQSKITNADVSTPEEAEEAFEEGIEIDAGEATHSDFVEAVTDRIEAIDYQALEHELVTRLASDDNLYSVLKDDSGIIYGFQLKQRGFVYEDEYGLSEFFSDVQGVVNDSKVPSNLIAQAYNLGNISLESENQQSSMSPDADPAYR